MKTQYLINSRSLIITDIESLSFFHEKKFKPVEKWLWDVYNHISLFSKVEIPNIAFSKN